MLFLWGDMMKVKLGDVCEIVSGTTPKSNCPEYWNGELNWITPAELNDDIVVVNESQRKITTKAVIDSNLRSFPAGTVLLSSRAPIGKVAIAGKEMYCNQGFKNLICSDFIYNKYLFYFLKSKVAYLNSLGRGATFKEISKTIVENIQINLPKKEEQYKIVYILDKIIEIISLRQQQLKKLDELVKSRFIEMFGDVVINSKNWEQTTLKNVAIGKLTYGSGASAINFNGKIRYIRITDISNDGELNDDIKSPSICDNKYLLNDGDILFARSGATVGKTFCFNKKRYGEAIYAGYLIRMIPDKKRVLPIYVFYYTKTDYYMSFISKAQKAVAQPNINAQEYGDLKICVPPIELQQRFVDFVKQTDKSKLEIQKSLDKLEILKKSLMQQYFG